VTGQVQQQAALDAGVPPDRILEFPTQIAAVDGLREGRIDAYASVAMAHRGFLSQNPDDRLAVVDLGSSDGAGSVPALGAYSFSLSDATLREAFDRELAGFLGSSAHREIMTRYGFPETSIDRIAHFA